VTTDAGRPGESPDALDQLGHQAYAVEDLEVARRHWEAAFRSYRLMGDYRGQARVAIQLGRMHFSTLGNEAAGRGWLARAGRLLDQVGPCVERGHLELALLGCDIRDPAELEQRAERALAIAADYGDSGLEFRALADLGLALVSQGRTAEGFARLDEAMVPVISGEIPHPGAIFCTVLTACERAGEVGRAQEWLRLCQELVIDHLDGRFPVLQAHCRVVYGSVLCTVGRWPEAEAELLQVLGPHGTTAFARRAEAVARLADLRILQGRLEEAAELLQPLEDRFEAAEALARLHLAWNEPQLAAAVLRRLRDQLGADRLRGVPVRALLVQAQLAGGHVEAAQAEAARLADFASTADSGAAQAEVLLTQARVDVRCGDHHAALARLKAAWRAVSRQELPLLAAAICLERAELAAAEGDVGTAITEAQAARAIFERIGASREADRARGLLRRLGVAVTRPHERAGGAAALTTREQQVLDLLAHGHTNAQIASRLFLSPKTVEHHVGRILAKLGVRSRAEAAAYAAAARPPAR
jgi:DNA-binding CsgD family transcriptional regulator/tetratricopeptide (TPR) repeat protein